MFDNFLLPHYTLSLASLLSHSPQWRLAHIQLSSAGRGFGVSSLSKDVQELVVGVDFIRRELLPKATTAEGSRQGKVVLMGHSTGTQDVLSYCFLENRTTGLLAERAKVDGVVLQAAVSDRDGATPHASTASSEQMRNWEACLEFAKATPEEKKRSTILPLHLTAKVFGPAPLSVERFWSLASPESPEGSWGEDDLFSADASEARLKETFGVTLAKNEEGEEGVLRPLKKTSRKEILVLQSKEDEHVPGHIDAEGLLERCKGVAEQAGGALHGSSGFIEGAVHDLSGDNAVSVGGREVTMRRAVWRYLRDVLGHDEGEEAVERILREAEGDVRRLEREEADEGGERKERGIEAKI